MRVGGSQSGSGYMSGRRSCGVTAPVTARTIGRTISAGTTPRASQEATVWRSTPMRRPSSAPEPHKEIACLRAFMTAIVRALRTVSTIRESAKRRIATWKPTPRLRVRAFFYKKSTRIVDTVRKARTLPLNASQSRCSKGERDATQGHQRRGLHQHPGARRQVHANAQWRWLVRQIASFCSRSLAS